MRVLRELADVTESLFSIIFEKTRRLRDIPEDWKKANVTPIFGNDLEEIQNIKGSSAIFHSLGKLWKEIFWELSQVR